MPGPLLPLNSGSLAIVAMPQILKACIRRLRHKDEVLEESAARQEFTFDQAFTLVKFFFERATLYTVEEVQASRTPTAGCRESLTTVQRFGNTTVPSPWWVHVVRVVIPPSQCDEAGRLLAQAFGPDEIAGVVGGEQWWQRRGQKDGGVEGEWIAMKEDWKHVKARDVQHAHLAGATSRTNPHLGAGAKAKHVLQRKSKKAENRPRRGTWKEEVGDDVAWREEERQTYKTARKALHRAASSEKQKQKDIEKARKRHARSERKKGQQEDKEMKEGTRPTTPVPAGSGFATEEETDVEQPRTENGTAEPKPSDEKTAEPKSSDEKTAEGVYAEEMDEMRCMLYIHGGGYYFGSVNTHRYTIWRYCRKMAGRAFAVSYRLSPQYPFPCALADCLASYLYLIRPPVGAKHCPVDPKKLVIAGDSAGGGLALALLTLIRDLKLPAPAGGVLISPWCDLTHSFPSILQNTKTDIIPPYGFMHQPSDLWPPPPPEFADSQRTHLENKGGRFRRTSTPLKPGATLSDPPNGDAATQQPSDARAEKGTGHNAEEKQANGKSEAKPWENPFIPKPHGERMKIVESAGGGGDEDTSEPKKILQMNIDGKDVEIAEQIQLYATNEQLTHPFCSPALAPSLGGLPPLFVIAGDKEVLRDEIVYIAHRAAHPDKYPLRKELLQAHPERAKMGENLPPTKVHLQVYDGMCHVLPLFSFTTPAKFCYRAIASFCKYVTSDDPDVASPASPTSMELPLETPRNMSAPLPSDAKDGSRDLERESSPRLTEGTQEAVERLRFKGKTIASAPTTKGPHPPKHKLDAKTLQELESSIYHAKHPFRRPAYADNMIRERIDVRGHVRPLEAAEKLEGCQLKPEEIGVIKEGPIKRWLEGKSKWGKKFGKKAKAIDGSRERNVKRSNSEEARRLKQRVSQKRKGTSKMTEAPISESPEEGPDEAQTWALPGERPPPSSIAARRDTVEALKLARAVDQQHEARRVPHPLAIWASLNEGPEHRNYEKADGDGEPRESDEVVGARP